MELARPSSRRNILWIFWAASALIAIGLFFIPAFIIRPFTHQSSSGLAVAMALRQRAPVGTLFAALVFLVFTLALWSAANKWSKIALGLVVVVVAFSTVMARLNYFEWMFHPVANPQFEAESESKLDNGEMILAIRSGSDTRAYPIREMAYHHIINDWLDGVPVAVTY
jgi:membrane protease YdiL (CAAX protease family)